MNTFDNIDLICEGSTQPFISVCRFAGGFTSGKNTFIYIARFDCFIRYSCIKYIKVCNTIYEVKECIKTKKMPIKSIKDKLEDNQQTLKF